MMEIWQAAVLGIVEGITEFLPVSSTGHLILASELLGVPESAFSTTFEIVIQLGAMLAVVALYARRFLETEVLKRLAVAFVPTGIAGIVLYPFAKNYLLGNEMLVVWTLALGGLALILFERLHTEGSQDTIESITYGQALAIGAFQAIAIVPGVSRSAATIVGGLLLGLRRVTIVEFSFLLAVPTIAAASGYDLLHTGEFSGSELGVLLIGLIISFVVAAAAITWLLRFVRSHTFIPFGVYRIAAAVAFYFIFIAIR